MDKQPLVTAVVTTYKRSVEIVKRALSSIVEQTYDCLLYTSDAADEL